MGLLSKTAYEVVRHLATRAQNAAMLAALEHACQARLPEIVRIKEELETGSWQGRRLCLEFALPAGQSCEGTLEWGECWQCPSVDLLMYYDQFGPYDPRNPSPPDAPRIWEGVLELRLSAHEKVLDVDIPLNSPPWTEPRVWAEQLARVACHAGYRSQKAFKQLFLDDFRRPTPGTDRLAWRMQVTPEIPYEEILAQLGIGAWQRTFPVAEEEEGTAYQWIRAVMGDGFSRWKGDTHAQQRWLDEHVSAVWEKLSQEFDLPASHLSLRTYIEKSARGRKLDAWKQRPSPGPEPYVDPASGARLYPDAWVGKDSGVSAKTVARWRKKHGIQPPGLTDAQLVDFRQDYQPKRDRQALRALGMDLGMTQDAIKKTIYRGEQKGLSREAIAALLQRHAAQHERRREVGATAPSVARPGYAPRGARRP